MLVPGIWYFPALVIAWVCYWALPNRPRVRLSFLLVASAASLLYMLWSQLDNGMLAAVCVLFVFNALTTYALARTLRKKRSRILLALALALPWTAFLPWQCAWGGFCKPSTAMSWIAPISIGFFALRQIHFTYESYRGNIKRHGLLEFAVYLAFFPTIIAGPIERYGRFIEQVQTAFHWEHVTVGGERLVIGAFKKFVVADLLLGALIAPDELTRNGFGTVSWGVAMFAATAKFLYVYAEFSGYSDMAIGTARLFGFRIMENFNFPLLRSNLAEFWRAWHMSLASMARDYVFFPILVGTRHSALALVSTMLAIAAWHGVSPGWLLWGMHHGIGLVVLAAFQRRAPRWRWLAPVRASIAWRLAATLATLQFVAMGYALTWHPADAPLALRTYAKLWTFGIWP